MENYLFFTDLHISKDSLKECSLILDEILDLCNKFNITHVFNVGDTFDVIKPTSLELTLFADFIKKLNRPITILIANSHESLSIEDSILNHFALLSDMVTVVKEYTDESHLYLGHFIVNESKQNYGGTKSKTDLVAYKYVILGHGHQPELIAPNICQLGSSRYVSFAEANDKEKLVCIINDYKTDAEKVIFQPLKAPYPMKEVLVSTLSEKTQKKALSCLQLFKFLDQLDPKTKVKVKIQDFESFKLYLPSEEKYQSKFIKYVRENDFEIVTLKKDPKNNLVSLADNLKNWLSEHKVDDEIQTIIKEEINVK